MYADSLSENSIKPLKLTKPIAFKVLFYLQLAIYSGYIIGLVIGAIVRYQPITDQLRSVIAEDAGILFNAVIMFLLLLIFEIVTEISMAPIMENYDAIISVLVSIEIFAMSFLSAIYAPKGLLMNNYMSNTVFSLMHMLFDSFSPYVREWGFILYMFVIFVIAMSIVLYFITGDFFDLLLSFILRIVDGISTVIGNIFEFLFDQEVGLLKLSTVLTVLFFGYYLATLFIEDHTGPEDYLGWICFASFVLIIIVQLLTLPVANDIQSSFIEDHFRETDVNNPKATVIAILLLIAGIAGLIYLNVTGRVESISQFGETLRNTDYEDTLGIMTGDQPVLTFFIAVVAANFTGRLLGFIEKKLGGNKFYDVIKVLLTPIYTILGAIFLENYIWETILGLVSADSERGFFGWIFNIIYKVEDSFLLFVVLPFWVVFIVITVLVLGVVLFNELLTFFLLVNICAIMNGVIIKTGLADFSPTLTSILIPVALGYITPLFFDTLSASLLETFGLGIDTAFDTAVDMSFEFDGSSVVEKANLITENLKKTKPKDADKAKKEDYKKDNEGSSEYYHEDYDPDYAPDYDPDHESDYNSDYDPDDDSNNEPKIKYEDDMFNF